MRRVMLVWLLLAGVAEAYDDVFVREVTSIYDGDTFRVTIEGWPPALGERIPVRIKGIDTPELRGQCMREKQMARIAKQYTVNALRQARQIELRNIERDKYFRLLADVYVDDENLGTLLLKQNLAVAWEGRRSGRWCSAAPPVTHASNSPQPSEER